ncbi:MAG TPA: metallophosphoesterase family protein [Anaerolineaceae bacterium]|nr:metallophosphoesterase family protein [Anaerolineaceae bacterium]
MRVLIISDIHANRTALEAVLEDAGAVDAVWCLGDLVGYGPDPNECIDRVRQLPNLVCLLGNHDAAALGQLDLGSFNREAQVSMQYMQRTLTRESLEFLAGLPEMEVIEPVTLAHGSPRNPIWEYLLDIYTVAANFKSFHTRLCFVGHTHIQIVYDQDDQGQVTWRVPDANEPIYLIRRSILNPGSVGQPRDHDPRAAYAIFDSETMIWEPRRVRYDIDAVQERIRQAGLPVRHAVRLAEGW